jgi:DEAD/DEAH box helicase domain-containing protein
MAGSIAGPAGSEIFLDVETLRLSDEVPGGWSNIRDFGLALAVTWDPGNAFRTWYEEHSGSLLTELAAFARIVTFNGDRFDLEVLSAYGAVEPLRVKSFDVLASLRRELGFRVKLDSLARETLGCAKCGSGLDAVRWWREGKKDKVAEYCRQDVQILRDIVAHGREQGHVVVDGRKIPVRWK